MFHIHIFLFTNIRMKFHKLNELRKIINGEFKKNQGLRRESFGIDSRNINCTAEDINNTLMNKVLCSVHVPIFSRVRNTGNYIFIYFLILLTCANKMLQQAPNTGL